MESLYTTKKNMFLTIREGIGDALGELDKLSKCKINRVNYLEHFDYRLKEGHRR